MRGSVGLALVLLLVAGCATSAPRRSSGRLEVVAAENVWGSLVASLGGTRVHVRSVVDSPDADPHDYEPTAQDARRMALADLTVVNGVGYDGWAHRLVAANPRKSRVDLDVGELLGVPDGGNPHRWYSPADVRAVVDAVTAALTRLEPGSSAYFAAQRTKVLTVDLKGYFDAIAAIKAGYGGTPVGASESAFALLAPQLGLRLVTPESFLDAVSEGTDPTAQDRRTADRQITRRQIEVYVYNSQNATPDVQAQVRAARSAGVPVVTVTETLVPAGASFQDWQVGQLTRLQQALAAA